MDKSTGTVGTWLNFIGKTLGDWLRLLLIATMFAGPAVQAQTIGFVTFTSLAANTTGGTVAAGGTWPARINGSVKASTSGDAVNLIRLMSGSTEYAQQSYSTSEPPVNSSRNPGTLVANLPVGVHDMYLIAYTVNGTPASSGTFRVTVTQSGPANDAQFISQSNVPSTMTVSTGATATVVMKNTGTATWPAGATYQLGAQASNWGTTRVSLPASVAPGASATFSVPITAPSTAGTYTFQWGMIQGSTWFGEASTATSISVTAPNTPPTATLTAPTSSANYVIGSSSATVSIPVAGSGTDSNGIKKMEILDNGSPIASVNASSINQTVVLSSGLHVLRVRATDNLDAQTTSSGSATITITVDDGGAVFSSNSVSPTSAQVTGTNTTTITANASASAAASNDAVKLLEVFKVGSSTPLASQTYTVAWSGGHEVPINTQRSFSKTFSLGAGTHEIYFRATTEMGGSKNSGSTTVNITRLNTPPTVSMSSPSSSTSYEVGMNQSTYNVSMIGSASDSDGSIAKIEAMDGSTVLGTFTTSSINQSFPLGVGLHSLWLRATDNEGGVTSTGQISVTITNPVPTATMTAPASAQSYVVAAGGSANVTVTGSGSDSNGNVSRMDVLDNGSFIANSVGTGTPSQISKVVSLGIGRHSLQLQATDNLGATGLSTPITIAVNENATPNVTMSSPSSNANYSIPPSATVTIPVSATATDSDGTVTLMQVLVNGVEEANSGTASINANVVLGQGTHTVAVKATDNLGGTKTSSVTITVSGDPNAPIFTTPVVTPTSGDAGANGTLTVRGTVQAESGISNDAVNKITLFERMPNNSEVPLATSTYTVTWSGGHEVPINTRRSFDKSVDLTAGTHNLFFRAYTELGMSADASVFPVTVTLTNVPPTVSITAPSANATVNTSAGVATAAVRITGSASDSDGTVTQIEVLDDTTVLETIAATSVDKVYALPIGPHKIALRATDNRLGKTTSSVFIITVVNPAPSAKITAPANDGGYVVNAGGTVSVRVTGSATDVNGSVQTLSIMDDANVLATVNNTGNIDRNVPLSVGPHSIYIKAVDNLGAEGFSPTRTVTVMTQGSGVAFSNVSVALPFRQVISGASTLTATARATAVATTANDAVFSLEVWKAGATAQDPDTRVASQQYPQQVDTVPVNDPKTIQAAINLQAGTHKIYFRATTFEQKQFLSETKIVSFGVPVAPVVSLTAPSGNVSLKAAAGQNSVDVVVAGSATDPDGQIKLIELLDGTTVIWADENTGTINMSVPLQVGPHTLTIRATDNSGMVASSASATVTVTAPGILGQVTGVRIDPDNSAQLTGWACLDTSSSILNYEVFVGAAPDQGGTKIGAGTAALDTELDNAGVLAACHTTGGGHHFKFNLTSFSAQYIGSPIFVRASTQDGVMKKTLPCGDNLCTMPGNLRIGLTTPANGDRYAYPTNVFMRLQVTNGSGTYDELAFNIDGEWINATADQAVGAYFASKTGLQVRPAAYTVYAKVRQGKSTLFTAPKQFYMVNDGGATATMSSPTNGATVSAGQSVTLSAAITGTKVVKVDFYANGVPVATGLNSAGTWGASWIPAVPGNYTITARAFDGTALQLTESPAISVTAKWAASSETPIPVLITPPHLGNGDAGTLPGSLGVDNAGVATYAIPIVVPPGTAGLAPALGLSYSGGGPNGHVGIGWALTGESSIHRCGRTIAQDRINDRVSFANTDRLCLDGQRLVVVNKDVSADAAVNDANYWADDAEYRTEIESFSRIKAQGTGIGQRTFVVETKDGRMVTYGNGSAAVQPYLGGTINSGANSQQPTAKSGPRAWAIDKVLDKSKNYITYSYEQNSTTGEQQLRFVRYGGVGKAPHGGVEIVYESRNDAWKRFVDETRDDLRTRIAFIRTHVGADLNGQMTDATLVRNYKLQYEYSPTSGRSMLNSVQVCAMNRNGTAVEECLPATTFVWGKPVKQPGFVSVGFWETAPVLTTVRDNVARNNAGYFAFSDFNNDGFADVLEKRIAPLSGANSVDESNTNQPGVMQASYRYFHNNGNGFTVYNYGLNTGEPFMVAEVGDFNGDGALDLVVSTAPNQPLKVCLSPLTGQRAPASGVIVFECSAYYSTNGLMGITSENPPPYVADLKGDGRSGMFARTDNPEVTSVCAQNECTEVVNPDLGILQKTVPEEFNPLLTPFTYTSLMQSVDFSGAGRSYDVRWTKPYYVYKIWLDNEYVYSPRWTNLRPEIRVSSLNYPTPANANIGKFTSYVYPTTYPATPVGKPPYLFDAPRQTGGMSADFNGSGYNSLAFGFKELQYGAYGVSQYSIADFTVCLSTGRALDCEVRAKYSGNNYRSIISIGNFVGDGQASILTQTMTSTPELGPFPTGNLEMCSLRGDSTGTADSNLVCEPWGGVTLNNAGQSSAGVQYYFMDLRGTGRMQIVKYHGGTNASGTFVDPGRWEVFEPIDRAATGEALDRIVSVTNGVGLVSRVEYADSLRSGVVKQTGTNALTYPQRPISNPDKIVSRLIVGTGFSADRANPQGRAAERRTSYEYQDMATDVEGRGSLGFATVIAKDEDTSLRTTSHFRQLWPYTGMLSSSTVEHGATVLAATTNVLSSKPIVHAKGRTVFPYIEQGTVVRKDLGGQELGTTVTVDAYNDDYGNLNQQTVSSSTATGGNFITDIVTSYRNDTTRWLLGLPELVTTTRTVPKGTGTAAAVRQLQRIYDIETGLLKTEIAEPNSVPVRLTSTYGRNTFGQVESVTQTWIDPIDGGSKSRVASTMTFDNNGVFMKTRKNAVNPELEYFAFDAATGAQTSHTDLNGLTSSWSVNGFGRQLVQTNADGNAVRNYVKRCDSVCPAGATVVQILDVFNNGARTAPPRLTYLDAVGHVLRGRSYGFNGDSIFTDQRYNALGQLSEVDQPRYEAENAKPAKRMSYDHLGRTVNVESINDGGNWKSAVTDYQGFTTVLTNALNQKRIELRNVAGNLVTVTDAKNGVISFEYEPFGELSKTIDPMGNVIGVKYDARGFKTELKDPDLGIIAYTPDPLGRVRRSESPNQRNATPKQATLFEFDNLDRMVRRLEPSLDSRWEYDSAVNGKGKLYRAYTGTAGPNDYERTHSYDVKGRLVTISTKLKYGPFMKQFGYDPWGRLLRETYKRDTAATKDFDLRYNALGFLYRVERNGVVLWQANEQDAANRVTSAGLGNFLIQKQEFNEHTGRLTNTDLETASAGRRLHEGYEYDDLGNVKKRIQAWDIGNFMEEFTYDDLNRLESSQEGNRPKLNYTYDNVGNILTKSGVGTYRYPAQGPGAVRPHAVKSIDELGAVGFDYDANGNRTTTPFGNASWTSFDMPDRLTKGTIWAQFVYGPEHQRVRQVRSDGSDLTYASGQEVEGKASSTVVRTYWPMALGMEVETIATTSGSTTELYWTHTDRLGSVVAISRANGELQERLEFDPWGKRRTRANVTTDPSVDNKGYTSHEMLDQLDMVHMNGRVYDPLLGRFLSGDPIIQDPHNGQNYSRYSYVFNNPTNMTDPTGFEGQTQQEQVHVTGARSLPSTALIFAWTNAKNQTIYYHVIRKDSSTLRVTAFVRNQSANKENSVAQVEPKCNQKGCWETPAEKELREKGDVVGYYDLACKGGDAYACNAGRIASNDGSTTGLTGLLTPMTNVRLSENILGKLRNPTDDELKKALAAVDNIKLGLMQGYGEYMSNGTPSNPIMPSRQYITELHYRVFEKNGADRSVFGGSTVDKIPPLDFLIRVIGGYDWCPRCGK